MCIPSLSQDPFLLQRDHSEELLAHLQLIIQLLPLFRCSVYTSRHPICATGDLLFLRLWTLWVFRVNPDWQVVGGKVTIWCARIFLGMSELLLLFGFIILTLFCFVFARLLIGFNNRTVLERSILTISVHLLTFLLKLCRKKYIHWSQKVKDTVKNWVHVKNSFGFIVQIFRIVLKWQTHLILSFPHNGFTVCRGSYL